MGLPSSRWLARVRETGRGEGARFVVGRLSLEDGQDEGVRAYASLQMCSEK